MARAFRTVRYNRADSELADAVKLLLGTLSVIILKCPLAPRERKLKRSALALLEVLLEGAKGGFITNEMVGVMGHTAMWLRTSDDRRLTIKLCHLLLGLHAIKSIRTLRDEPGRIVLSTGSTDVLASFLVMCDMAYSFSREDPEGARREGLAPTPALLGSVLRHMATVAKESRAGRWSEMHDGLMVPLGRFISYFGSWIWPSGLPASALEQLDLPADSRADLALALGLYLAGETEASQLSFLALSPTIQMMLSPVLSLHTSSFLRAPGCLAKLVDLAEGPGGGLIGSIAVHVLYATFELEPKSVFPLLQTKAFKRLVDVAFRLETINLLDSSLLSALFTLSIIVSIEDGPDLVCELDIDGTLSKASSRLPARLLRP